MPTQWQTGGPSGTPAVGDGDITLRPGTRIGRYAIVNVLGQGGFGITYRATDTQLGREVALKEYLPASFALRQSDSMVVPHSLQVADDFRWGRERFLAEAKTLAHLENARGVVNVYDFLEANGTAYLVMALVRGETLEARLRREGRLPQPVIERLLYPLLDGLERVHRANFLHRDIKPANILIDAEGAPALIDFGASRMALQGRTQAMTAIYTPGYAAFEQLSSLPQGPWTDIYALAGTLYHCIAGAPPPPSMDRMIKDRLVPAMEAGKGLYAPGLLAAIDAGLALPAEQRPQSIAAWRSLLPAGSEAALSRAGAASHATSAPRGKRLLVIAVAAIVVLVGMGGLYFWQQAAESARLAEARKQAEEKAKADAETRRRADEKAKADAETRRQAEERARADAEARRQAEETRQRRAAEEKANQERQARTRLEEERKRLFESCLASPDTAADQTIARCTEAIQFGSDDLKQLAEAYVLRSRAFLAKNDVPAALRDVEEALRRDPAHPRGLNVLGVIYIALGQNDKALQILNDAVRVCRVECWRPLRNRARAHGYLKRFEAAIRDVSDALALKGDDPEFITERGNYYSELRQCARALQDFEYAIKLNPNEQAAHFGCGVCYFDMRQYDRSMQCYNQAIRLKPDSAAAYYNRSNVKRAKGDMAGAAADLARARAIDPDIDKRAQ
jgi:tetratricopeptide (TPR) repeat protein